LTAAGTVGYNTGANSSPACRRSRDNREAGTTGREVETGAGNIEVAKPQLFDGMPSRVAGFITGCKLYIRNKLAGTTVEAQVQWVLSYMQGGSADV